MQQAVGGVQRQAIGTWQDVVIDVIGAGAVDAPVELAVAGMFTHEADQALPVGGLHELDEALSGALMRLRADGIFSGKIGETIALAMPRPPIKADTVLIVGLGDPDTWQPSVMTDAVRLVVKEAARREVSTVAFAPSLLDSGLHAANLVGTPRALMLGLIQGLTEEAPKLLRGWSFCSGIDGFVSLASAFHLAFDEISDA